MKRQKQVFKTEEVAHIWASQSQEEGRNSQANLYFVGTTIYSYGSHFPMAEIHTAKNGEQFTLHTSRTYSNTTNKHQHYAWRAVLHMPRFEVPNIFNPRAAENVQHLGNLVADAFMAIISRRTGFAGNSWRKGSYLLERLNEVIEEFNEYCKFFGIKDRIELDYETLSDLKALMAVKAKAEKASDAKRAERDKEKCAQRELERAKNKAERAQKLKDLPKELDTWERGDGEAPDLAYSATVRLRINPRDRIIETSHGATVDFADAIIFIGQLERGELKTGMKVGRYEFKKITKKELVIGCHNIPIKEFKKVSDWLLNRPSNVIPLNARGAK
jgi:hypothetical protein